MDLFDIAVAKKLSGGGGGGGGGDSDFSIAQVTVSLNSQYADYYGAITGNFAEIGVGECTQNGVSCEQGVNVITAVLYKGKAVANVDTDGTVKITGSARFASDHYTIIISGDCTITIS